MICIVDDFHILTRALVGLIFLRALVGGGGRFCPPYDLRNYMTYKSEILHET